MSITMQGSWTVEVKSKSAAYPQRFVIAGAGAENGPHPHNSPPVFVTGDSWTITVQSDPGSGWVDSEHQIKFPTTGAGRYRFDIETNDPGSDQDFNDLILTCSTPQTATDFLIYGHVSYYSGYCFNPCWPRFVVIDSPLVLAQALKNRTLRSTIEKLYPDRLLADRPQVGPIPPDPPPFRPLVIPLSGPAATPARQAQVLSLSPVETKPKKGRGKQAAETEILNEVSVARLFERESSFATATIDYDRLGVASIVDRWRPRCETGPLPGVALRFQEYDRTALELAGAAYSGDGDRENLGVCATDRNGNYIFRFQRSLAEFFAEANADTAVGETEVVQSMPDVIAQLLDPMAVGGFAYESAPKWNVPVLRRLDLCIPESTLGGGLNPCNENLIIQAIGNVFIGPEKVDGTRQGFNNFLGVTGKITAKNTRGPRTQCAAWAGRLDFYACLNNPEIRYYTIRYRRPWDPVGVWQFVQETYRHDRVSKIHIPGYIGDLVGASDVNLEVDGVAQSAKAYDNIEVQTGWIGTHIRRKVQLRSAIYEDGQPGPVLFRIEGYRADGSRFPGADDTVTLFIDNTAPQLILDPTITMGAQTLGNCALFTVPEADPGEPLTVRFKVDQAQGFLQSYRLYMEKGATGHFPVLPQKTPPNMVAPYRHREYEHVDDLACALFHGTFDDPTADAVTGFATVDLTPTSGRWLEVGQPFCAFSVRLRGEKRATNGYGGFGPWHAYPEVLIGIEA